MQNRDYDNVKDPSLLRFLVDMRGADTEDKQLRDDLMTLLIAGHETTAAALTWGFFSLAQAPSALKALQDEVDKVVGDRRPSWDDIKEMPFLCNVCSNSPEPPCRLRMRLLEFDVDIDWGCIACCCQYAYVHHFAMLPVYRMLADSVGCICRTGFIFVWSSVASATHDCGHS